MKLPRETSLGNLCHQVGLVSQLPHDAIVGRDFLKFWELWDLPDSPLSASSEPKCTPRKTYCEVSPEFPLSITYFSISPSDRGVS